MIEPDAPPDADDSSERSELIADILAGLVDDDDLLAEAFDADAEPNS